MDRINFNASADLPPLVEKVGNFIGGAWEGVEAESFEAINPATKEVLAILPKSSRATARRAVDAAADASRGWAGTSAWERADLCGALGRAIEARASELARILSIEQGKPIAEAEWEVGAAAHGFHMAAEMVRYATGEFVGGATPGRQVITRRAPRGVYAVITPWNYPVNIPVEYIAPGLATGNTIVWTPAPTTSLVAVALMRILADAGMPAGILNMVIGEGAVVGDEIVASEKTHAIGFTGSTATGHRIAVRGAGKPMLLELGGNGPLIVRRDADLRRAAEAAAFGAFSNSGQICAATGRVLADAEIAEVLAKEIASIAATHRVGNPMHQGVTMGPLNNANVARKVAEHVDDALANGAKCLIGGRAMPELGSDLFYAPTVLSEVTSSMKIAKEETFGPVIPIVALSGDDEILRVANDTEYGLSMAIFTRDIERGLAMSSELSAGIVNINESTVYWETHMPFGGSSGTKSGLGRIGGRHAIEAMSEVRSVSIPFPHYNAAGA